MKLSDRNREILLEHLRGRIESYATQFAEDLFSSSPSVTPFDEAERKAMEKMKNDPEGYKSLIKKLLEEHCRFTFFDFFCILDGVGDPDDKDWTGVLLIDKPDDFEDYVEFLHDEF